MKSTIATAALFVFLHHAIRAHASTTEDVTTQDISDTTTQYIDVTTCGHPDCVNGDDRDNCVATCNCDVENITYFHGNACETVILNGTVETETSARTCNLTWEYPPNIDESNYQFVYMAIGIDADNATKTLKEIETVLNVIYKQDFNMLNETIARVTSLESGGVIYTLCVIENAEANDLIEFQNTSRINSSIHNDCVDIVTENNELPWEFTLAAYIISGLLILAVIALIIIKFVADQLEAKQKETYQQLANEQNEENAIDQQPRKKKKREKAATEIQQGAKKTVTSMNYSDRSNYMEHVLASQMVHSKAERRNDKFEGSENVTFEHDQTDTLRLKSQQQQEDETIDGDSEPDADY